MGWMEKRLSKPLAVWGNSKQKRIDMNKDKIFQFFAYVCGIAELLLFIFVISSGITVSSETTTVTAVVMDADYHVLSTTPFATWKNMIMSQSQPKYYIVTVRYEDEDYHIQTDEATYNKCKTMVFGTDTIKAVLTVKKDKAGYVKKYMSFKE